MKKLKKLTLKELETTEQIQTMSLEEVNGFKGGSLVYFEGSWTNMLDEVVCCYGSDLSSSNKITAAELLKANIPTSTYLNVIFNQGTLHLADHVPGFNLLVDIDKTITEMGKTYARNELNKIIEAFEYYNVNFSDSIYYSPSGNIYNIDGKLMY